MIHRGPLVSTPSCHNIWKCLLLVTISGPDFSWYEYRMFFDFERIKCEES